MRILLVKTSSLGDVIHNLPVASDLRQHFPDAVIDWVVEESFADIPRLHPAVRRVIPVAVRRWRKQWLSSDTWREIRLCSRLVRQEPYDVVIDTQGLLKSALISHRASGRRCGFDAASVREPMASRFYDETFRVSKALHAVTRNQRLAALALRYDPPQRPDYGLRSIGSESMAAVTPARPEQSALGVPAFAVLLTATSRDDKLWPEDRWVALGRWLHGHGIVAHLPAGTAAERARAERIARQIPEATALPAQTLTALALHMHHAAIVVGVDTGLVHLAAALDRPTLALFCASDPALTGVFAGPQAINLGTRGQAAGVDAVIAAAEPLLRSCPVD